jgi:hypothetical protein
LKSAKKTLKVAALAAVLTAVTLLSSGCIAIEAPAPVVIAPE